MLRLCSLSFPKSAQFHTDTPCLSLLSTLSLDHVHSILLSFAQFSSVLLNSAQFRSVLHSFVQSCSVSLSFAQIIFTQVCLVRSVSLYCLSMCVYTLLPTLSMKFFGLISLVVFICLHYSSIVIQFRVLDGRGPGPPPPPGAAEDVRISPCNRGARGAFRVLVRCAYGCWLGRRHNSQNMLFILSRMAKGTVQYRGGTAYTPAASGPCSLYYCTSTAMAFERL